MAFIYENPNPKGALIGDCAVRAVAIANDMTWDDTYNMLCDYGFAMKNLPNADSVWGAALKDLGFTRHTIPNTCPDCYTIREGRYAENRYGGETRYMEDDGYPERRR